MFSLAKAKEAWVGDLWSLERGGGCWNPTFFRSFNDLEMENVERSLCQTEERRVTKGVEDTLRWMKTKNGLFLVKPMYRALEQRTLISFHWKCTWKNRVQPNCVSLLGRLLGERF